MESERRCIVKARLALQDLKACGDAVRWVGDKSPREAWSQCVEPDWLLWLIARLGETDPYYERACCAAVAACIDVLAAENIFTGRLFGPGGLFSERKVIASKEHANRVSVALDRMGQGRKVKRLPKVSYKWLSHRYTWAMEAAVVGGAAMVNRERRPRSIGRLARDIAIDLSVGGLTDLMLCREIRRVVERPTVRDIMRAVGKEG